MVKVLCLVLQEQVLFLDDFSNTGYNLIMDVKVYQKEEVLQPDGIEYVYVPDVIDIIPVTTEIEVTNAIQNNVWDIDLLKSVADVKIENNKLIINSDKVRYENGNLYVTLMTDELLTCELVEEESEVEQQCALATIFQRGLDPLDKSDGIRWSETLLGEISPVQLMNDITVAVERTSSSMTVVFDTVIDSNGMTYLTYKLKEIA